MSKTNILIVDDYRENIHALSQLIEADDVQVFSAESANAALSILTEQDIALALIDIQMPQVTGIELAQLIRGVNRYKDLPMIFVTAHQEDQSLIVQGYESGGVDILFKPLNPVIVRSKVRAFVELRKKTDLLKKSIHDLVQLKVEADAANRAKSDFLANMSHEIRTPLSAVLGFSEILANSNATDAEKKRCRTAIHNNGNQLMRLIDEVLDFSKIEANQLELISESFSLYDLIKDVDMTLSQRKAEKSIQVHFFMLAVSPDDWFVGDAHRIKQVLLNLIGNAIKFTYEGDVEVEVTVEAGPNADSSKFRIQVKDHGIGIDPKFTAALFTPFTQSDSTTSKNFGGAGLGLAISQRIMRLMGGDVVLLSSQRTEGSTFEVSFVLNKDYGRSKTAAQTQKDEKQVVDFAQTLNGKTVLAVDDSGDNLELLEFMLDEYNVSLTCVQDGNSAYDLVTQNSYDLILMDIQMPQIDGYETTRRIRKFGFTQPIIALTAHVVKSEIEKCYQAGCNAVVGKPYSKNSLMNAIAQNLP
jgi:signal transduction histidine kinase